jgi:hypothetical protein
MKKAGYLLDPVLRKLGIEAGVRLAQMKNEWHTLFDKSLSLHMFPVRLSEGELLLSVDSPIWIQQLTYYKREIIGKLAGYGVKEVRFRIGAVSRTKQAPASPPPLSPLSAEDQGFVDALAGCVRDPEVGRAVSAAAERSIRAKKRSRR